jgi:tungstate transport system substrate-binding protein
VASLWSERVILASGVIAIAAALLLAGAAYGEDRFIIVASTTSTEDSGLFGYILPRFTAKSGIRVKVVAQGTGQALETGRRGDADVLLVHAKPQEEKFVAAGYGVQRYDVMYNDFVLIGPRADPSALKGGRDIVTAFRRIGATGTPFVSRGDQSGTHLAELGLWKQAGLDPAAQKPGWYRAIGQGMGAALNTAAAMGAYVLSDRGTWIAFQNGSALQIIVEGDKRLFNQYGIMLVNPAKHPSVKQDLGQAFIDWMLSVEGQNAIRSYKIRDQQLFFPNAASAPMRKAG